MSLDFDPNSVALCCDHLIGNIRIDRGGTPIPVVRPSDGQEIGAIRQADEAVVDEAVQAAHQAFLHSGWAQASPLERAAVLKRWANLIDENREELAQLEAATTTRPIDDVTSRDLPRAAGALRYFAEWSDKVEGTVLAGIAGTTSLLCPEPYGVVASIAPFNFPAINAVWKSAPALAVGNGVVLKPSELTPYSALRIAELAVAAGLPVGLFNVVQGGGGTGSRLVRHPLIRMITFTGSSATGAKVMADAAATGTKPLTLELGGKTPQLVLSDVRDLGPVATNVANGFLANSGQVCTAGSRLIVPEDKCDELVARIIEIANRRVAGPTWRSGSTLPPIISEKQAQRVERLLAQTVADGAKVICGGQRVAQQNAGAYFAPTLIKDVPQSSVGYREEFFGPILSVSTYSDEEDGISMANHPSYALAASIYTTDMKKSLSVPARLEAGTVWINAHGRQPEYSMSQGGFNGSGFGKELGRSGLESFLRVKSVFIDHR